MDERARLAERQAELVRALCRGGEPAGFDPAQLRRSALALRRKRQRTVARGWPALTASLGEAFPELFAAYAETERLPEGGPLADGRLFARWLEGRRTLEPAAAREVLLFDVTRRLDAGGRLSRRRLAVGVRRPPGVVLAALRIGRRSWLASLPIGRFRS